jgi:uncharacterized protein YrrD
MPELGEPSSYLELSPGTPVYAAEGERLGKVEHVLAEPDVDVFDGLVVDTSVLPGGRRFVDATQIREIYDRGVLLDVTRAEAEELPQPSANPATMEAGPQDTVPDELRDKLRRAWDLISGRE